VAKSCPRRYADMARAIGEKFDSDAEGATRFINDLRKLIETVGLPSSLRQLGIDENDFRSKLENLAAETFVDDSAIAIPRMPSVQELSRLFTYSFDGRDIDF
jgi:alcohol dehydrogenase class IV